METRKIISFGSSSYVVSVPKSWILQHKLKKGDTIQVENRKDELALYPGEVHRKDEPKRILIDVNGNDLELIKSKIISAYLNNYVIIDIKGAELPKTASVIKGIIRNLTGFEIIQQTETKITAKDLLNIREISLPTLVRRIDNIVRSMIMDSIDCLNTCHYESINDRDKDVNRLVFLARRVIHGIFEDPSLVRYFKMNLVELMFVRDIVIHLEKVGDKTKRIARSLKSAENLTKEEKEHFRTIYTDTYNSYLTVMKAYYKRTTALAFEVELDNKNRIKKCNDYVEDVLKNDPVDTAQAMDNLRSMSVCIGMIAKSVLGIGEDTIKLE